MARGTLIAEGTFHYTEAGTETGRESWQLSRLGHGGYLFDSRNDVTRPNTQSWLVTYELSAKWAPRGVTIRLEHDQQVMRAEQKAQGKKWNAHVESPAGAQDFTLDFSHQHQVLFVSPIFYGVILLRALLTQGQSRELDAVVIQSGSLAPSAEKQTWTFVGEDKVQVPAGEFSALKYEMKNAATNEATQMWSNSHGIVVRLVKPEQREIQLTHYRWLARL